MYGTDFCLYPTEKYIYVQWSGLNFFFSNSIFNRTVRLIESTEYSNGIFAQSDLKTPECKLNHNRQSQVLITFFVDPTNALKLCIVLCENMKKPVKFRIFSDWQIWQREKIIDKYKTPN